MTGSLHTITDTHLQSLHCQHLTHIWVTVEDVKSVHDLLGTGSAANIEEVGRKTSVQFDDVHGGHCQPGTIDWKKMVNQTVNFELLIAASTVVYSVPVLTEGALRHCTHVAMLHDQQTSNCYLLQSIRSRTSEILSYTNSIG